MNASAQVNPFISTDFTVPEKIETKEFRLRMLTVNDVVKDYDAVMSSTARPSGLAADGRKVLLSNRT